MDFQTLYGFFFGFQVIAKFSIKSKKGSGCYKKLTFADRYIIFRIEKTKMECTLGVSLCLILQNVFLLDMHKFMRRTWSVR